MHMEVAMNRRIDVLRNWQFSASVLLFFVSLFVRWGSTIMVPAFLNDEYTLAGNRSYFSTEIFYSQDERREISNFIPCFESFIERHFKDQDRVSVLVVDAIDNLSDTINFLLESLQMNLPSYILHGELDPSAKYNTSRGAVIIVENLTSFDNSSSLYLYLCGRDCRFVVVMASVFDDEEQFVEEADNLIQLMWAYSAARLVVLARVLDTVVLAGSPTFIPEETCLPASPTVQGKCKNNVWNLGEEIVKRPMNNCFVNIAFFENYPYASLLNDSQEVIGIEGTLIKEVVKSLKANAALDQIAWTNDIYADIQTRLNSTGEFDVVCGGLIWKPDSEIDFTVPYEMTRVLWMIPETPNVSLRGLITPFSTKVWIASVAALIFGIFAKYLLIQDITLLDIFAIVLGVSTNKQPTKTPSRIKYMSWVLFSFFMCQFYLATLAVQLLNEQIAHIETVAELVSSGLMLGGPYELQEIFQVIDDEDDDTEEDEIIDYIQRNFITFERAEYLDKLADLKSGRNSSLALIVMANVTDTNSMNDGFHGYMTKESLGNFPLALATWRGVPYLREINRQILSLVEGGFVNFWAETLDSRERYYCNQDAFTANLLGLKQLIPGFLLLAIGYGLAGILLIIEIIAYPSKWLE